MLSSALFCFIYYNEKFHVLANSSSKPSLRKPRLCFSMCVFKLFEMYMRIVILTLIARWPEFHSSCCMVVFIVRIILNMNSLLLFLPSKPLTFHLDTCHFWQVLASSFQRFEIQPFPKHFYGKTSIMFHKTQLVNLTVRITVNVKLDGCILNEKSSWPAGIFTSLYSYIVSY